MSNSFFPGGRHKTAPYDSTHIRIPKPLKSQFQKIAEIYKSLLAHRSEIGLGNFNLQLDKFVEGHNPMFGVTNDDFKIVSTNQYEELKTLYDLASAHKQRLIKEQESFELQKRQAVGILKDSLKLKANAGGAIKGEIKKALAELGEDF